MPLPRFRLLLISCCLLALCACAHNRPRPAPPSPPRLPSWSIVRACPPLAPDPGTKATQALTADTPNRDAHVECQQRQLAATRFILELIGHGYVLPPASADGLAAPKP